MRLGTIEAEIIAGIARYRSMSIREEFLKIA